MNYSVKGRRLGNVRLGQGNGTVVYGGAAIVEWSVTGENGGNGRDACSSALHQESHKNWSGIKPELERNPYFETHSTKAVSIAAHVLD
jgi:hypothetical protein